MDQFAQRMSRVEGSAIREILKLAADPEMISFSGGSPAKETFPVDEIQDILHRALSEQSAAALQYGITEGWAPLRRAYLDHIAAPKGLEAGVDNVLITTGATQGIHLAADVFLDEGDVVLVESPTFLTTLMVLNKYHCVCVPVETDEGGMRMDDLEEKMKQHHPKLLYCIPTFQNPTGRTLTLERRKKVAELAATHNVIVLEDDPYCDLRYHGEALPPIKAFDTAQRVVLLNSFSKIIAPGIRVGTVLAHPAAIKKMTVAKQCADTHTANLPQIICAEYLNRGLLPAHLREITPLYARRMEAMTQGIDSYFPKGTAYTRPEGGLFIWVTLPGTPDIDQLFRRATGECKVAFVPGAPFYVRPEDGNRSLRLNFSSNSLEMIETGIRRLGELFSAQG